MVGCGESRLVAWLKDAFLLLSSCYSRDKEDIDEPLKHDQWKSLLHGVRGADTTLGLEPLDYVRILNTCKTLGL